MLSNLFEHTNAQWVRYSAYEWQTASDGKEYLMPAKDASPEVYDPLEMSEQLVVDAINIGLMIFHKASDEKLKKQILAFSCQYGLLGLMAAIPTTPKFTEYEKVYLPKNPFIREEVMETEAYLKLFFPFNQPAFYKKGIESLWNVGNKEPTQMALAMTFSNEPQSKALSFMRDYGERFDWLKEVFRDWAFTFMSSFLYHHDRELLDENTLALYRQGIACFDGIAPSYHLELRDETVMVWDFHSLLLAIRFMLSLSLTDKKNQLTMCEYCQKAFIAKRSDSQFCSETCRKKYRQESSKE